MEDPSKFNLMAMPHATAAIEVDGLKTRWLTLALSFFWLREIHLLLTGLLIIYTPKTSTWRIATIPLHLAFFILEYRSVEYNIIPGWSAPFKTYRGILSSTAAAQTIVFIGLQAMLRLDFQSLCTLSKKETALAQLAWLRGLISNPRCLGTPWEPRTIPPFYEKRPGFVPSRASFVITKIKKLVALYLLRDILINFVGPRIHHGLYWALFNRLWLDFYHQIGGLIAVGLFQSRVETWPPLFDSFRHSSTLRGFWGRFWHQCLRFTLTMPSDYICKEVLRLKPGTFIQRYVNTLFVFAISAAIHIVIAVYLGYKWNNNGAMTAFCLQALGIMMEDFVQGIWRQWRMALEVPTTEPSPRWTKILGFIWTWTFLCLTMGIFVRGYWDHFIAGHDIFFSPFSTLLSMARDSHPSAPMAEL